jgi:hypothetical protein
MKDIKKQINAAKGIADFNGKEKHLDFLFNYINIFNTYKYYGCDDWLYKEFEDIEKDYRIKKRYEEAWNIDMDAIIECVNILKENNFKF